MINRLQLLLSLEEERCCPSVRVAHCLQTHKTCWPDKAEKLASGATGRRRESMKIRYLITLLTTLLGLLPLSALGQKPTQSYEEDYRGADVRVSIGDAGVRDIPLD